MLAARQTLASLGVHHGTTSIHSRETAEEMPVALVYNGSTHAVLMATPSDLIDLGLGFSITEGMISHPDDVLGIDIVEQADGVEVRIWLAPSASARHLHRRRAIIGPTGCGLCGVESLQAALIELEPVGRQAFWRADEIMAAVAALSPHQALGRATRAAHAAGLWLDGRMVAVREDVGRHNALDKLAGATWSEPAMARGIVALTSRVSVEMVQKAARMGVGCIAAISAPTALAVRTAEAADVVLAAIVRTDGFEVFSHRDRILPALED